MTANNERWLAERLLESADAKSKKEKEDMSATFPWANYQLSPEITNMTLNNRKKVSDTMEESLYASMEEKYKWKVQMKVFLDTNIIIDFYDKRDKFYYPAAIIFDLAYKGKIQIYVSAITFVNAFFLLRKSYEREDLYQSMRGLVSLCEITDVDKNIIKKSLVEERKDFEDSVQYESSLLHEVYAIIISYTHLVL